MKPSPTALLIDKDLATRRLLRNVLEPQGYRILESENREEGLQEALEHRPDVILLELAMTSDDGLELVHSLREWSQVPVLILSERGSDADKVAALDAGANDYMTKPFSSVELLARLRVLQRTFPWVADGPLLIEGGLVVNLGTHEVSLNGSPIKLTPTEEALFYLLVRHAGKIITRPHLVRAIWGSEAPNKRHDLAVHIARLRKKFCDGASGIQIASDGQIGYRLVISPAPEPAKV